MNEEALKYFKSLAPIERRSICNRAGISYKWLINMIYEKRSCSPSVALRLESATCGKVSRWSLRPDINWALVENP